MDNLVPSVPRALIIVIVIAEAGRQVRQRLLVAVIAGWTRHAGAATAAGPIAEPRPFRVVLANPSAIVADKASHEHMPLLKSITSDQFGGRVETQPTLPRSSVFEVSTDVRPRPFQQAAESAATTGRIAAM